MALWKACLIAATIGAAGCCFTVASWSQQSSPSQQQQSQFGTHPVIAGTSNKFFTANSSRELKPAAGTKVIPIPGQDGRVLGYIIVARDNDTAGVSCSGSCSNSEGNPCGGCAAQPGLPDSIITCGCETSACAPTGGGCSAGQTGLGWVFMNSMRQ
jgi:hypothetical protein